MRAQTIFTLFFAIMLCGGIASATESITVGSKIFTESYILAEAASQLIETSSKVPVERKLGLGSTGVLFESLKSGFIDVYPDYTGTVAETILKDPSLKSVENIQAALKPLGLTISRSLGFNNTYALAVRKDFAQKFKLRTVSDLKAIAPSVRAAFSYEFMDRQDGYRGMVDRYDLKFSPDRVREMEHALVYRAINENAADVIEIYSTDANIKKFNLQVLTDDLDYFPAYEAVWVARLAFTQAHPSEWKILTDKEGSLNEDKMRQMNAAVDIDRQTPATTASKFLNRAPAASSGLSGLSGQILLRTGEHLRLVGFALLFSIFIGIPLGVLATRNRLIGQLILLGSSIVQTIPALALLCFLIPLFGIGLLPALIALCLYSLLPVVLNTFTALRSIDEKHIENARAFGLTQLQILTRIELPLASPSILAGVRTALIVSVGTATLAALIGAGGYGALIVSGLSLNDVPVILSGAIPAAVMALLANVGFGLLSRVIVPLGLRKSL